MLAAAAPAGPIWFSGFGFGASVSGFDFESRRTVHG
jgi:hypothetical protein